MQPPNREIIAFSSPAMSDRSEKIWCVRFFPYLGSTSTSSIATYDLMNSNPNICRIDNFIQFLKKNNHKPNFQYSKKTSKYNTSKCFYLHPVETNPLQPSFSTENMATMFRSSFAPSRYAPTKPKPKARGTPHSSHSERRSTLLELPCVLLHHTWTARQWIKTPRFFTTKKIRWAG